MIDLLCYMTMLRWLLINGDKVAVRFQFWLISFKEGFMKLSVIFSIALLLFFVSPVKAATTLVYDNVRSPDVALQGGSDSSVKWHVPDTRNYRVSVYVPIETSATNVWYRIYPKGSDGSVSCNSDNAKYPCHEIVVDHSANKGKWVQLMLNGNIKTSWRFGASGFVSLNALNSANTEQIAASTVRFGYLATTDDFNKIANNGWALNSSAKLGASPTSWACTRDDTTGLMWEIKTNDGGLRDKDNTFSWFNQNTATNGGFAGYPNRGVCAVGPCDTQSYVYNVNQQGLCSYHDWRLPTIYELKNLVNTSTIPTINQTYFPNTQDAFWSSSIYGSKYYVWSLDFSSELGISYGVFKDFGMSVMLVRKVK
ncbi:MAG: Lcl C-terminal domain-containing protein [Methylococcaceae bacterium]